MRMGLVVVDGVHDDDDDGVVVVLGVGCIGAE